MSHLSKKPIYLGAYQEWTNFPTYCVIKRIREENHEKQLHYQQHARTFATKTFQHDIIVYLESFLKGWSPSHSIEAKIVRDWLFYGLQIIEWGIVYDLVRDKAIDWVPNEWTLAVVHLMKQAPWQDVVEHVGYDREEGNSRLCHWAYAMVRLWLNNLTARVPSPLSFFISMMYEGILSSINWQEVTKELKK